MRRQGESLSLLPQSGHPGCRAGLEVMGADMPVGASELFDLGARPSVASAPELPGQQTIASERVPFRVHGPVAAWAFGSV